MKAQVKTPQPGKAKSQAAVAARRTSLSVLPVSGGFQSKPCSCGGGCSSCSQIATQSNVSSLPHYDNTVAIGDNERDQPSGFEKVEVSETKNHLKDKAPAATDGISTKNLPGHVQDVLSRPGNPLDTQAKAFYESYFRNDLSHVRTHNHAMAKTSTEAFSAAGYTIGNDIVINSARLGNSKNKERYLLAHEIAHTLQAEASHEAPLTNYKTDSAEREADTAAREIAPKKQRKSTFTPTIRSRRSAAIHLAVALPEGTEDAQVEESEEQQAENKKPTRNLCTDPNFDTLLNLCQLDFIDALAEMARGDKDGKNQQAEVEQSPEISPTEEVEISENLRWLIDSAIEKLEQQSIDSPRARLENLFLLSFFKELREEKNLAKLTEGLGDLASLLPSLLSSGPQNVLSFGQQYVKGIAVGFMVDGLLGYVKLFVDLACLTPSMINMACEALSLLDEIPQEIQDVIDSMYAIPEAVAETVEELKEKLYSVQNLHQQFWQFLAELNINSEIDRLVSEAGRGMASNALEVLNGPQSHVSAYDLGRMVGSISFDVVISAAAAAVTAPAGGSGAAVTGGSAILKRFTALLVKQSMKLANKIRPVIKALVMLVDDVMSYVIAAGKKVPQWLQPVTDKLGEFFSKWKLLLLKIIFKQNRRKSDRQDENTDSQTVGWKWFKSKFRKTAKKFLKSQSKGATKQGLKQELDELKDKVHNKYDEKLQYTFERQYGYFLVYASFKGESADVIEKIPLESKERWLIGKRDIKAELDEFGGSATMEQVQHKIEGDKEDYFYDQLTVENDPPDLVVMGAMSPLTEIERIRLSSGPDDIIGLFLAKVIQVNNIDLNRKRLCNVVCRRFTITKDSGIPKVCTRYRDIKRTVGDDCVANYTVYFSRHENKRICQCNEPSNNPSHSELIALYSDENIIDALINLKNPCQACFRAILKVMWDRDDGPALVLTFKQGPNVREDRELKRACISKNLIDGDDCEIT
ncbi:MAG: DUF4157 domain-containing protein [Candidatus Thiodiazotropha sp. L084R]